MSALQMERPPREVEITELDDATVAQGEAQLRWRLYLEALEENADDLSERQAALADSLAVLRTAWSAYHGTVAEVGLGPHLRSVE